MLVSMLFLLNVLLRAVLFLRRPLLLVLLISGRLLLRGIKILVVFRVMLLRGSVVVL